MAVRVGCEGRVHPRPLTNMIFFPTSLTDRISGATINQTTDTMGVRPWKTRGAQCLLTVKSAVAR